MRLSCYTIVFSEAKHLDQYLHCLLQSALGLVLMLTISAIIYTV